SSRWKGTVRYVALYMSAWIEIDDDADDIEIFNHVALYMSAWIEIRIAGIVFSCFGVALYMSAWIEISATSLMSGTSSPVALYMSAWIEIFRNHKSHLIIGLSYSVWSVWIARQPVFSWKAYLFYKVRM
uniref:hypothetical protein n=1 Tax=Paenibacillus sp. 1-18 TaxID=1333846 RepID=UPI003FA566DC